MSLRNFLALGVAVGSGVLISTYTLGPAFAEQAQHRQLELKPKDPAQSGASKDDRPNSLQPETPASSQAPVEISKRE